LDVGAIDFRRYLGQGLKSKQFHLNTNMGDKDDALDSFSRNLNLALENARNIIESHYELTSGSPGQTKVLLPSYQAQAIKSIIKEHIQPVCENKKDAYKALFENMLRSTILSLVG
jgi:hypothetical protein